MPETPSAAGATHRFEVRVAHDDAELVAAQLWAAGALGVWEQPARLVAWFDDPDPELPEALEAGGTWSPEPDRDWQEEWKATIEPVRAGAITVVPTWLADHPHAADPEAADPEAADPEAAGSEATRHEARRELAIVLDPGRAFGSGHHATTTMCLELLDELELAGRTVADVGCGTGVLAIAAALRGATAVAVDIDPTAIEVTAENAARNGVTVGLAVGSVEALPLGGSPADVVVANLVTDVIVTLAHALVGACHDVLVVSGIATTRADLARSALEAAGATVVDVRERDGWVALRCHAPPNDSDRGCQPA